jgi:hypothetical protein
MGSQESPSVRAYVRLLAVEARRLQHEARVALEQGQFARATALIGDAELLAEDVHHLVGDIERCEIGGLITLDDYDDYDVREAALPVPPSAQLRFALPLRRLRLAIGTGLMMSLALTEW